MFRKFVHSIMIVLLLATSTGFTFYEHYCGNNLESFSINAQPHSCCGEACHSCHNKSITVKINDDFSPSAFHFEFHSFMPLLLPALSPVAEQQFASPVIIVRNNEPPPPSLNTVLSSLQTYRL